jgi:hypothetical protein
VPKKCIISISACSNLRAFPFMISSSLMTIN